MMPTLTEEERQALLLRHHAALDVLASDATATPEELLVYVVWPSPAVHAASLEAVRRASGEAA